MPIQVIQELFAAALGIALLDEIDETLGIKHRPIFQMRLGEAIVLTREDLVKLPGFHLFMMHGKQEKRCMSRCKGQAQLRCITYLVSVVVIIHEVPSDGA